MLNYLFLGIGVNVVVVFFYLGYEGFFILILLENLVGDVVVFYI